MKEQEICDLLKTYLDEERYTHTLGVRDCAVRLAGRYGVDIDKARLAGLLHDCAKCLSKESMMSKMREAGYELGRGIFQNEALMHGPAGAVVARQVFGVQDPEILSAIECHTTGKKNMSTLDKIIYLADIIEPNRDYPGVDELRAAAMEDLDKAVLLGLRRGIERVLATNRYLHPRTIEAWNDMLSTQKNVDRGN
ncbi:MAG: HD domain-containing protein [Clostridiales bacterium]|jgi:predicted HD superfamily hydrolase involved in NAD metabolism|nr:HD domain-containing protein [Clostridiales bacterium]